MKNLPLGAVLFSMSMFVFAADQDVVDHYNRSCIACHASGAAKAPRAFNETEWKPRLAKGMDQLLLNIKHGINAMPPKGMCMDCTDDDYKALIAYMSSAKK